MSAFIEVYAILKLDECIFRFFETYKRPINDIILYNIINDCLLITLGHEKKY